MLVSTMVKLTHRYEHQVGRKVSLQRKMLMLPKKTLV
jgi:hypothetical protein